MAAVQGALTAAERSMRSVFVGNIPYEATEEQLKDIFAEVGPVVSFRLVYDRETGKPKGYGFCEYKDQEMALSAMRNLNGYELNGRALRVDNAASEKSKEELKNLQASLGGVAVESPYGAEVIPENAPDAIARVMCSLSPEQLYELMVEMKQCIENNPNEARTLLMQNPQLSYALLQAQVILGIIDTEHAVAILHPKGTPAPHLSGLLPTPEKNIQTSTQQVPSALNDNISSFSSNMQQQQHPHPTSGSRMTSPPNPNARAPAGMLPISRPSLLGDRPLLRPPGLGQFQDRDPHSLGDHDLRHPPTMEKELRPPPMLTGDKDLRQPMVDQDMRSLAGAGPDSGRGFDPRFRGIPGLSSRGMDSRGSDMRPMPPGDVNLRGPMFDRGPAMGRGQIPPHMMDHGGQTSSVGNSGNQLGRGMQNPRVGAVASESPVIGGNSPSSVSSPQTNLAAAVAAIAPHDREKARLIMQVLQLSDQQIAMLPADQRQSILVLKEQISRSQQA